MSRSLTFVALTALAFAGWLVPAASGQQMKFSQRAKPAMNQNNRVAIPEAQRLPRGQNVSTAPRKTLELTAPKFSGSIPPQQQPAAFGPASVKLPSVNTITLPAVDKKKPMNRSGRQQRPIEPGQTPAGDPRIAGGRLRELGASQLDPAVRSLNLNREATGLPRAGGLGRERLPAGPAGAAAPAIGNRGLAANGTGPNREQQQLIWNGLQSDTRGPNPTAYRHGNEIYTMSPDGRRTYWGHNSNGDLYRLEENRDRRTGETTSYSGVVTLPNGEQKEFQTRPGENRNTHHISADEPSSGDPKNSSSPGVEGGGTGVDGRERRLPQRQDRGEFGRQGPPNSVVQPAEQGPHSFGPGRPVGQIEAPAFRRGGYLPFTPRAQRGKGLATQPFEQENGRAGQQIDNRSYVERVQEAVVNPSDR